jgi:EAL domain-containing protein (putative c-di-GMP-specific phosphodiesterase class I)
LLCAVAARLQGVLRDDDTLARLGGDEFALLLEDVTDLPVVLRVAEPLGAALAAPLVVAGRDLVAAASIGLALRSGGDAPTDLLRFADVALYRAKAAGGAGFVAFYPGMNAAALDRLDLEHDLRQAVAAATIAVYYQPLVDLTSGRIVGFEALARWPHPTRGLVSPGLFIPLAEETGLIVPLGRAVLRAACQQLRTWQAQYPTSTPPCLSVNLSARQFRHPDLVADIAAILAETGLPPGQLHLEVTETVAMAQAETAGATLAALRGLGVRLAIDDFGTGYSSLAYLQRLPVDTLKIDRVFFRDGAHNRAIVRAVTALAHGLGLVVTAEGLETAEQVAGAQAAGCDQGQGYYFARPVPAEKVAALWAAGLRCVLPDPDPLPATGAPADAQR